MFKRIARKLNLAPFHERSVDPSVFGDPAATRSDWTPLRSGGANFTTHKLVRASAERFEFRAGTGAILFSIVFILFGCGALVAFFIAGASSKAGFFSIQAIMSLLFFIIFAGAGSAMLRAMTMPVVFDKRKGFFWKGRKRPDEVFDRSTLNHFAELRDIHALQIVSERCHSKNSSYYSYELNLALENGSRLNVVDHGNLKRIREDAAALSEFLEKPVWDATQSVLKGAAYPMSNKEARMSG